jgi:aminopeptidase
MADIRVEKLAELLVDYSVGVKKGDKVAIESSGPAEPLVKAVYARVLQAGGYPFLSFQPAGIDEIFYRYASDDQLKYVSEISKHIVGTYDVRIYIDGASNTKALSRVDPAKMVMRSTARRGLTEKMLERSAAGELRWVVTLFPTNAFAQDAEMGLSEYEDLFGLHAGHRRPGRILAAVLPETGRNHRLAER